MTPWQPSLFVAPTPPSVKETAPEQARQAARVGKGIDEEVMAVARECVGGGPFLLGWFTEQVMDRASCAPDSPRRRLSALVKAGFIQAEVVDRGRSLWRVVSVREGDR